MSASGKNRSRKGTIDSDHVHPYKMFETLAKESASKVRSMKGQAIFIYDDDFSENASAQRTYHIISEILRCRKMAKTTTKDGSFSKTF